MGNFLPDGYEQPESTSGSYFKPTEQKTKVRVMSSAIVWRVDWNKSGKKPKPIRTRKKPETSLDPSRPAKHFRAFVIRNYSKQDLQIWEITQKSIMDQFSTLINWEWWDPHWYDLIVRKEWQSLDTVYYLSTTPQAIKPVKPEITEKRLNTKIDLDELYSWWDPFNPESKF